MSYKILNKDKQMCTNYVGTGYTKYLQEKSLNQHIGTSAYKSSDLFNCPPESEIRISVIVQCVYFTWTSKTPLVIKLKY